MNDLYLKVYWDPAFTGGPGGQYHGTPLAVLVSKQAVDANGLSAAFLNATGHNPGNIVRCSEDVLYTKDGLPFEPIEVSELTIETSEPDCQLQEPTVPEAAASQGVEVYSSNGGEVYAAQEIQVEEPQELEVSEPHLVTRRAA
jgi:hypothetical protein